MKILCDVHISYKLVKYLKNKAIEVQHLNAILDKWNTNDNDLCRYADENNYMIVSKDKDFRNSYFLQGKPKKLIKVNLGNITNDELIEIFDKNLSLFIDAFKKDRCYIELNKEHITVILE